MSRYKVTQRTFGLGLSSATSQTRAVEEHINEHAAMGWELVQADKSSLELPITWRFIWKVPPDADA
jgi:hypothetical protein